MASDGGTAIVILKARAVVCNMDINGVVWSACQVQSLHTHTIGYVAEIDCKGCTLELLTSTLATCKPCAGLTCN